MLTKNKFFPALSLLAYANLNAYAQQVSPNDAVQKPTTTAEPKAASAPADNKVVVAGKKLNELQQREVSSIAKTIIGREELDRYGDSSVLDVLKRIPGVTLGGSPRSRSAMPQLRGMGGGLTQIRVDGQAPPPGFSLDDLPPEGVERIEVVRGATVEFSTQAIAGTINIVLREGFRLKENQVRIGDEIEEGKHSPSINIVVPKQSGSLQYTIAGSLNERRRTSETRNHAFDVIPDTGSELVTDSTYENRFVFKMRSLFLQPSMSYRFDGGSFSLNASAGRNEFSGSGFANGTNTATSAFNTVSQSQNESISTFGFLNANFNVKPKLGGQFNGSLRLNSNNSRSGSHNLTTFPNGGSPNAQYASASTSESQGFGTTGKYTMPILGGHAWATGWDLSVGKIEQVRSTFINDVQQFPADGTDVGANTLRTAAYVQDEWQINPQWSSNLGLRWERTQTKSTAGRHIQNTAAVWSPVLHAQYRIPDSQGKQIRMSLAKTYRAPNLPDLIAAPYSSPSNRATSPDISGNPDLKPELSNGLDVAYEHYMSATELLSIGMFARHINGVMRRQTTLQNTPTGPRWVNMPINAGDANVYGIELESKVSLANRIPGAPDIDLRASLNRYWMQGQTLYGVGNNANTNPGKFGATLGVDYRMKVLPLTMGGSFVYNNAGDIRLSDIESSHTSAKRVLDVYGLYKLSRNTRLRLSASNLLAQPFEEAKIIAERHSDSRTPTYATLGLRLEMNL
jgi:iron complex outermembrane receptor protein